MGDRKEKFNYFTYSLEAYAALLPIVQLLCETRRRRSANRLLLLVLWAVRTLSDQARSYAMGSLSGAEVDYQNGSWIDPHYFWAVHLLMLNCLGPTSSYSLADNENWTGLLASYLWDAAYVVYFVWVGSGISVSWQQQGVVSLSALCALSLLRIWQKISARRHGCPDTGLGENAKKIADHMEHEHELPAGDTVLDPVDLCGYHYLVMGENESDVTDGGCRWRLYAKQKGRVVTVDMVWRCPGTLLSESGGGDEKPRRRLKDLCLSFALYKLLAGRLAAYQRAERRHTKTRELVLSRLLHGVPSQDGDAATVERAFRVVETELAFLYEALYTSYPVFFARWWSPVLFSLVSLAVVSSYAAVAFPLWHATRVVFSRQDFTQKEDYLIQYVLSLVAVGVAILTELMELLAYLKSNWGKVVLLCLYVRKRHWEDSKLAEAVVGFMCRVPSQKPWQRKLGQYSLLHRPRCRGLVGKVPTWLGLAGGARVQLPEEVKAEVLRALKRLVVADGGVDGPITNGKSLLTREGVPRESLAWAFDFDTASTAHTILVWHVATTLCDDGASPSCTNSLQLRGVACCLSKYCAYLVASAPSLLPDPVYTTTFLLRKASSQAGELTKDCETMDSVRRKLMGSDDSADHSADDSAGDSADISAGDSADDSASDSAGYSTIVVAGAKLGRILVTETGEELRWRILVDFWTEMLLYVAQSGEPRIHADRLTSGGEFITHVWAFLSHTGQVGESPVNPARPPATPPISSLSLSISLKID